MKSLLDLFKQFTPDEHFLMPSRSAWPRLEDPFLVFGG